MLRSAPPSRLLVSVRLLLLFCVLAEVAAASSSCPLAAAASVGQSSLLASVSPCFRAAAGFVVGTGAGMLLLGQQVGSWESGRN